MADGEETVFGGEPRQRVGFALTYNQGKAVQEALQRYKDGLAGDRESLQLIHEETWQVQKDIDYVEGLIKLFD
jgi:hypothetical protein